MKLFIMVQSGPIMERGVSVFIKLHVTAQSGRVLLFKSHFMLLACPKGGINDCCACLCLVVAWLCWPGLHFS